MHLAADLSMDSPRLLFVALVLYRCTEIDESGHQKLRDERTAFGLRRYLRRFKFIQDIRTRCSRYIQQSIDKSLAYVISVCRKERCPREVVPFIKQGVRAAQISVSSFINHCVQADQLPATGTVTAKLSIIDDPILSQKWLEEFRGGLGRLLDSEENSPSAGPYRQLLVRMSI